jgi:SAM-dependent methyltransferase
MADDLPGDETPVRTSSAECDKLHKALDAAVAQTAPIAWQAAGESCFRDPATGEGCAAYHGSWQYLLLLGVRNSTWPDTPFLLDTFRGFARRGDRRILVSGSADYAMLAHILRAYELEGEVPAVTLIDRCETPLALNRWYADRAGVPIETVRSDAISFAAPQAFDIVCTHSFIGWFSPEDRERLVARWAGNLRPGGHVVTTRRVRKATSGDGRHGYDTDELASFEQKVRDAVAAHSDPVGVNPEALVEAAVEDARSRVRYTMTSPEELVALFERHGLHVVVTDADASTEPSANHLPSGPVRGAGKRVRIVARLEAAP